MQDRIAIIGAGAWGTAIAILLANKGTSRVTLWCARPESGRELLQSRENRRLLPGVRIPDAVTITTDEEEAVAEADCWVLAVPTLFLQTTLRRFANRGRADAAVVSLTKGIESGTLRLPTEICAEICRPTRYAVLSGPSHAEEVSRGLPTSLVVASSDSTLAGWVQARFSTDRFRIYTNNDRIGVELAGALKNVMGIAAGICDGLKFGDNAKAALLTRGLVEMTRFGVAHGADPATFSGLAGIGDLITTCFSPHGRNRSVGERLARGESLESILAGPKVAEGINTARSVHERSQQMRLDVPIMSGVYSVLYENVSPLDAVQNLMTRKQRGEY